MNDSREGVGENKGVAWVLRPFRTNTSREYAEYGLAEMISLAEALGLTVSFHELLRTPTIRPGTYMGTGTAERLLKQMEAEGRPEVVVVDAPLSPVQQRNLERLWKVKVIDRTGLILEIFALRARTSEGRLQVELALLSYQRSRLVRAWTHLERQRGASGTVGGPGESQLELDRRLIEGRIDQLKLRLEKVTKTRALHRAARGRVPYPVVALVGYTNAGKSTLFNRLTSSEVFAADQLFATLDPTMRLLKLPSGMQIILSDTVGFISDLPTELVAAFRATLEEVCHADLLLHVRDISHSEWANQEASVLSVLGQLGEEDSFASRIIPVNNKVDVLCQEAGVPLNSAGVPEALAAAGINPSEGIAVSALTGFGCPELLRTIEMALSSGDQNYTFEVPFEDGKALAWLHAHGAVLNQKERETGLRVEVRLSEINVAKFQKIFHYSMTTPTTQPQSYPDLLS